MDIWYVCVNCNVGVSIRGHDNDVYAIQFNLSPTLSIEFCKLGHDFGVKQILSRRCLFNGKWILLFGNVTQKRQSIGQQQTGPETLHSACHWTIRLAGTLQRFHRIRKQQGTTTTRARCRDGTFRCHDSLMGVWMRLIHPPDYSEDWDFHEMFSGRIQTHMFNIIQPLAYTTQNKHICVFGTTFIILAFQKNTTP